MEEATDTDKQDLQSEQMSPVLSLILTYDTMCDLQNYISVFRIKNYIQLINKQSK